MHIRERHLFHFSSDAAAVWWKWGHFFGCTCPITGFAGEDWLHTWCDNGPEEVWRPPTWSCSFRGSANHRYRGKDQLPSRSEQVFRIQTSAWWHSYLCSNSCCFDSLPLRADGNVFNWNPAGVLFSYWNWDVFMLPSVRYLSAKYPETCLRMSWFRSLRKPAPSGTCDWWWIHSAAWTEATPLSLSALKKLHSRRWNW